MKNLFNTIKMAMPNTNRFDLTHDVKLSTIMGRLTPIMCMECVPGDKFDISAESLIRFAPLTAPVMHRMDVTMHYFFVPNRILWPNWEKFITGDNLNPLDPSVTPVFPTISIDATDGVKSLPNYLGCPTVGAPIPVSAMPFAAYQRIWWEYYRDQNLITTPGQLVLTDGLQADSAAYKQLHTRAWEHDYFTSALPFAQKGPAVDVPLGEVQLKNDWYADLPDGEAPRFVDENNEGVPNSTILGRDVVGVEKIDYDSGGGPAGELLAYDPRNTLEVGATTINDLRRSFRLQEWLEKNARAGTRYIENIFAHFGVKSSDKRLNRPEYITGTKSPVIISEVLNTTGQISDTGAPQGNMAGHGISVTSGRAGSYYCEEHGYIIGIMSVMPKTAYQQGLPKHFTKYDRFDYFWPSFANIGEQEILNKEIYIQHTDPDGVFGYTPRYSEYKYMPSRVAGDFQDTLSFWHLGRIFETEPNLNDQFVECFPRRDIFAVEDANEDYLYCHVLNKVSASRKMPKYGTPMF